MKHTQGQWKASISHGTWIVESVNNNNECYPICTMDNFDGETVDKANANLIAASPTMLEALQEICGYAWSLDEIQPDEITYDKLLKILISIGILAERATAKAEGK